jgi:hypothetical protein
MKGDVTQKDKVFVALLAEFKAGQSILDEARVMYCLSPTHGARSVCQPPPTSAVSMSVDPLRSILLWAFCHFYVAEPQLCSYMCGVYALPTWNSMARAIAEAWVWAQRWCGCRRDRALTCARVWAQPSATATRVWVWSGVEVQIAYFLLRSISRGFCQAWRYKSHIFCFDLFF